MKQNNRIVVDIAKVQWALFGYRNQFGQWSNTAHLHSSRGEPYDPSAQCFQSNFRMEDYAVYHCIKDEWTPELRLKLTASEWLVYTGDKAVELNKVWGAKIFGSKKKRK